MNNLVKYDTASGEVTLDFNIVRQSIAVGEDITDAEIFNFMQLCKFKKLNPFLKEAYLVKFKGKCSIIVGLSVFQKRLNNHRLNEGFELGVITVDENKKIKRYEGTFFPDPEKLVGAYVIFKKKGCQPLTWTVALKDYQKMTTDKYTKKIRPQGQWQDMPAVMITKCCFVAGVRYFYPEEFGGLYSADEIGIDENEVIEVMQPIDDEQIEQLKTESISKKYNIDSDGLIKYILENCVKNNVLENENIEDIPKTKFKIVFDLITKYRLKKENELKIKEELSKKEKEKKDSKLEDEIKEAKKSPDPEALKDALIKKEEIEDKKETKKTNTKTKKTDDNKEVKKKNEK